MKKMLTKNITKTWYFKGDKQVDGIHDRISGDVIGISGDVTGIFGNIDNCDLSVEDRKKGVNVKTLVKGI